MDLQALFKINYGVFIVSSKKGEKLNGQIANTVFQISATPPTIAISINKENLTHQFIQESKVFSVSILSTETPMTFIGQFGFRSGRDIDKFKNVKYKIGKSGAPIVLEHSVAYIEAEVVASMDVATHTVFVGKVVDAEILNEKEPMTYDYYHKIKRGLTPKTAPTYVEEGRKEPKNKEDKSMQKYKCRVCGYIYDPEKGDPDSGIPPGTPFEKLPDNWVCPICGATKNAFDKVD